MSKRKVEAKHVQLIMKTGAVFDFWCEEFSINNGHASWKSIPGVEPRLEFALDFALQVQACVLLEFKSVTVDA